MKLLVLFYNRISTAKIISSLTEANTHTHPSRSIITVSPENTLSTTLNHGVGKTLPSLFLLQKIPFPN